MYDALIFAQQHNFTFCPFRPAFPGKPGTPWRQSGMEVKFTRITKGEHKTLDVVWSSFVF